MESTQNRSGHHLMIHWNLVTARSVHLAKTPSACETNNLKLSNPRTSAADSKEETAADGMDLSEGMRDGGAGGATGVRLCTLGAQGRELPREEVKREVERNLTGKESEA